MSPVSSRTVIPSGASRFPKLAVISAASAFIGATYTTLNESLFTTPFTMCCQMQSNYLYCNLQCSRNVKGLQLIFRGGKQMTALN